MKLQVKTKEKEPILLWLVLSVISTSLIFLFNTQKEYRFVVGFKTVLLHVILNSILVFFIAEKKINSGEIPFFNRIIIGSYISSLLLILCTNGNIEYHIWLLGSIIVSAIIYVNLGYIVLFQHVLITSFLGKYKSDQVIYLLIFGVVLCMLAKYMKERKLLKYIIVIVVSLDLILNFVMNDFLIRNILHNKILFSIIIDIILVVITYIVSRYYEGKINNKSRKSSQDKDFVYNKDSINETKKMNVASKIGSLDEFIKPDFILLKELNRYSNALYLRSRKVGKLSFLAAKEIGANEKLALAGGLYHDIGRMRDGDYVQKGIELINQYNMPSEIGDIINQHNVKYANPTSPEAAIVMLTVSILATKEILENNAINNGKLTSDKNNNLSMKKIIENVFDMRLSKHSLDESGMTICQFNHLKEFYSTHILSIIES